MSATIDERVVEMRFDNKQFEAETKTTLNTLQRLKVALTGLDSTKALSALNETVKNTKLSGLEASVQAIEKRFSTLGIVGMRVIQNLTDGVMNTLGKGLAFVKERIISGGITRAMNIENARFQLQALFANVEDGAAQVEEIMKNANKSVDGTAYAYDEAAKAASQFAASGIKAGDEMTNALRGIVGVASMTSSEYEGISRIFTTVAGNGRLMGDQLLQLSSRGLNAAATIADFTSKVASGATEASDEVKALVASFGTGVNTTEADIRDLTTKGQISFKLFTEAMTYAFADSAERANETFTGAFSNMKSALARIGQGFISPLIAQNSEVVLLFGAIREQINNVKSALVFDEELGNVNALSKQFTDAVLKMASVTTDFIKNADLSDTMSLFYYGVETVKNAAKGLYSILKPLARAAKETFLTFKTDDILKVAQQIEKLTSRMRLNEDQQKKLQTGFKGIFDILNSGLKIIIELVQAFIPAEESMGGFVDSSLDVFETFGLMLSRIAEGIDNSKLLKDAIHGVSKVMNTFVRWISKGAGKIADFTKKVQKSEKINKLFESMSNAASAMWKILEPIFDGIAEGAIQIASDLADFIPEAATVAAEALAGGLTELAKVFDGIDISDAQNAFEAFQMVLDGIFGSIQSNKGIMNYIKNIGDYIENIKNGDTIFPEGSLLGALFGENKGRSTFFGALSGDVTNSQNILQRFIGYITGTFGPAISNIFGELSVGGVASIGLGIGLFKAIDKLSKSVEGITGSIAAIPKNFSKVLGELANTLYTYQTKLKAEALLTLAKAIGIMALALIGLSFCDPERLMSATLALAAAAGVLVGAMGLLNKVNASIFTWQASIKALAKGFKNKLNASAVKDLAKSVGIIVASIAGIWYMYRTDEDALKKAVDLCTWIAGEVVILFLGVSVMSKFIHTGTEMFKIAGSVLALSWAISTIVSALSKLLKMKMPSDAEVDKRFDLLGKLMLRVGAMALALAGASRLAGKGKVDAKSILAMSASVYIMVAALETLLKMDLPNDGEVQSRMFLLGELIAGVSGLVIALGFAGRLSGGGMKATGSLIALCAVIGTLVAAIWVLTLMNMEKMFVATQMLVELIVVLAGAFVALGMIKSKSAAPAVAALSLLLLSLAGSLGVISMIPAAKLAKAVLAMTAAILSISVAFVAASKMNSSAVQKNILQLTITIGVLAAALGVLSLMPLKGLLAAAGTLSATLLAFAASLKIISTAYINEKALIGFVAGMAILAEIATAIGILANVGDWQSLLAAGGALSLTLLAFAACFAIISKVNVDVDAGTLVMMVANMAILLVIAESIKKIADFKPENLLAAATALSEVLIAVTGCMAILSYTKTDLKSAATVLLGVGMLAAITAALWILTTKLEHPEQTIFVAHALAEVLEAIAGVMRSVALVGLLGAGAMTGLAVLGTFVAGLTAFVAALGLLMMSPSTQAILEGGVKAMEIIGNAIGAFVGGIVGTIGDAIFNRLPEWGSKLSEFMDNMGGFFDGLNGLKGDIGKKAGQLAAAMLVFTAAELLAGIVDAISKDTGSSLVSLAKDLTMFAKEILPFLTLLNVIRPQAIEAAETLAQLMIKFTGAELLSGIASKLGMGESVSFVKFGEELAAFAPSLVSFANQTKDITKKSVKGAAAAAELLAEVANKLPKKEGLIQKLFGTSETFEDFGKELVSFGRAMMQFAPLVKNIDSSSVQGVAAAGEIMTTLANKLPRKNGLFQSIFGGSTSMSEFGAQLKSFGEAMVGFSNEIKNVSTFKIISAATAIDALVDLAKKASGTNFSGMTQLGTSLYYMASNGVKEFYKAFSDGIEPVSKALNNMIDSALKMLDARGIDYYESGYAAVRYLASGIADAATGQFQGLRLKMMAIGYHVVGGIQSGIEYKLPELAKTVAKMAQQIDKTLRIELDIHSPSKKTEKIGKYAVQGFANGITNNTKLIDKAIKTITNAFGKVYAKIYKIQSKQDKLLNSKIKFSSDRAKNNIVKKVDEIVAALEDKNKQLENLQEKQASAEEKAYNVMLEAQKAYEDAKSAYAQKVRKEEKEKSAKQLKEEADLAKIAYKNAQAEYERVANINKRKLTEEDKYWQKLLEIRKKGVDGAEYQSMSFQQFEMQILQQTASVLQAYTSELDSVTQEVNNSLSLFEQSLSYEAQRIQNAFQDIIGSYDLFSDVEEVKTITKTDLTDYIDNQINSMADFYDTYVGLESRLIGTSLWDYVSQLGPENISEMNALMTMTDEELAEYIQKYEDKVYNANLIAEEKAKNAADKVTKENLMQIAKDRVEAYTKLETSLGALTARTGNSALTEFLRTLGVEDQEMIDALSTMSDEELKEYADLYEQGLQKSTDVAKVKLKEVQEETEKQLQEIFGVKKKIDLFDFSEAFDGTMESLNTYLKKVKSKKVKKKVHSLNEELRVQLTDSVKEAFDGVDGQADKSGAEVATSAVRAVKRVMKKNEDVMEDEAEIYIDRTEDTKDESASAGQTVAANAVAGMESMASSYYEAGVNAGKGYVAGLLSQLEEVRAAAAELAAASASSAEEELDIHSPSRVMARIANFAALGFIGGLLDSVTKATLAGSSMAEGFRDGVEDGLGGLQQIIYEEMEHFDPVISPQVDLSSVFAAARNVNEMFNAAVAMNVQNAAETARIMNASPARQFNDMMERMADAQNRPNVTNNYNMEQNNYSPKALSAIEIYRNTNNQFSQLKGVLRNDQIHNRY